MRLKERRGERGLRKEPKTEVGIADSREVNLAMKMKREVNRK